MIMNPIFPGALAIILYLLGTGAQIVTQGNAKRFINCVSVSAVIVHGFSNYLAFFTEIGLNLSIYTMLSVTALAVVTIILFSNIHRPVESFFVVIFPIAAISILLQISSERAYLPRDDLSAGLLLHIFLSVLASGLLTVLAIQALILSFCNYALRHRKLAFVKKFPPLETIEKLLFEMLAAGLIVLSLSILTGFIYLEDIFNPGLLHHTLITLAAWLVFSVLLWGRIRNGWRGRTAARWALTGFGLLIVGYFGSKLVLEVIVRTS